MVTTDVTTALDVVRECLRQINPAVLSYDDWKATGMVSKAAGLPFAEWDAWSARDAARYRPTEMPSKWASFKGGNGRAVGVGTLVKMARDHGATVATRREDPGHELDWTDAIGGGHVTESDTDQAPVVPVKQSLAVTDTRWVQDVDLPDPGPFDPIGELRQYLKAVFKPDEHVGYVVAAREAKAQDGSTRWTPGNRGSYDRTAGALLDLLADCKELGEVVGDWNLEAGAWVRFNPLDGKGCTDQNVTAFRYALVECDDVSVERQYAIYKELELPIAALVSSGGKSLHAIVRIEAPDYAEYRKRVDFLYEACKANGLVVDQQNRNPSRLSRLPGATRNGVAQRLVAVNIGRVSWADWTEFMAAKTDDLPDVDPLAKVWEALPPLADVLIDGILRCGHKLLLTGPANAGKSMMLIHLAIAIAEGRKWLGWQCKQGRVLFVNLEVDRPSILHKIKAVYDALGITAPTLANLDVWTLRGYALPMAALAPRLIRRAAKGGYAAVIVDPIYKVQWGDENSAGDVARFCSNFDHICRELRCSAIYSHHHSKGAQGAKYAADRASGSGVFKRDPDALLDMVELTIEDARRAQLSNRWECAAMASMLDTALPDWRQECPQDTAVVANHLAEWAITKVGLEAVAKARAPAVTSAALATGWRLECGTVREFAKFSPVRVWFRFPVHTTACDELLADATADGEEPRKVRKEAVESVQSTIDADMALAYADLSKDGSEVTIDAMAKACQCNEDTIRDRIKKGAKRGSKIRYKGGRVYLETEPEDETRNPNPKH